jgi:ABC-type transport system involved in multi-copper enzyme maturation permease subunit
MGFAEFLNNNYTKVVLFILNVISIIIIYVFMGMEGTNNDTKKEFNGRITIITVFAVILMLAWWGLSSALFAGSPEATTYYMFFMMAFLLALSFIAVSIASMTKQ